MPCLNEAATLARCIDKARSFLIRSGIIGEVLIADSGSSDGSRQIAEQQGARVVQVTEHGYGNVLIGGIRAAHGWYVVMGDSDDSYDFSRLDGFIAKLRDGYQRVMGNRFLGDIKPGAMPKLHRYLGNPLLSGVGRVFFHSACHDLHCGLRGFRRDAILDLDLQAPGMEFASEMVVKATIHRLRITEVPTTLSPDGRTRAPHLRSWRDGWRHLRFLLLFSPSWLFLFPGAALSLVGLAMMGWLLPGPRVVGGVTFDIHTLFYSALAVVVGVHSMVFWVFAKVYGIREGFVPPDPRFHKLLHLMTLELGLVVGVWGGEDFGSLSPSFAMRLVIPLGTAILLACQIIYGAFFLSVLEIRAGRRL
jgi:glycosyltransferase involved in cell wall biosynthesis